MSASAPNPKKTEDILIISWMKYWNILAYLLLTIALVAAWIDPAITMTNRVLTLVLASIWGLWYWIFIINFRRWLGRHLVMAASFVFSMAVVAVACWITPSFLLLMFSYYGLTFSALPMRWAIPIVILLSLTLAARIMSFSGGLSIHNLPIIFYFLISGFFTIMLGLFITSIIRQSRERQHMIEELKSTRTELAKAERQAGILAERQRLAGEIHDTLAQGFTSILLHLEAADLELTSNQVASREHIAQARNAARENLAEARRFLWALKPEVLEREPLFKALTQVTQHWSEESQIPVNITVTGETHPLPTDLEITLLRIAQEALTNIRKHAQAHQVVVTLTYMNDEVLLDIQDDGQGFNPSRLGSIDSTQGEGFGLLAMRKRVEQLGGSLVLESLPGEGTTLAVELPLTTAAQQNVESDPLDEKQ